VMWNLVSPVRRKLWFAGAWYLDPSYGEYTFVRATGTANHLTVATIR
jgi:hypothetical protein